MDRSDALDAVRAARNELGLPPRELAAHTGSDESIVVVATAADEPPVRYYVEIHSGRIYEMPTACRTAEVFERFYPTGETRKPLEVRGGTA